MGVQVREDASNVAFILGGDALSKENETVVQDGGRSGDMVSKTLMTYDAATGKWAPYTDNTATDGTQYPKGILLKTLTEAEIIAGDVVGVPILVGNAIVAAAQLVIENSKTLATVINVPVNMNVSVEQALRWIGIFVETTVDITSPENV